MLTNTAAIPKQSFMHHCTDCNYHFNQPDYWIVEDKLGYPKKIPYCPKCVSQNIERTEITG